MAEPAETAAAASIEADHRGPWSGREGWHVADWGPWGWAETAVKLVAIVIAVVVAVADARAAVPDDHRLTFWLVVAAAVGYLFAIFDRLQDREIVAMVFVFAVIVGHWSLVLVMGRDGDLPGRPAGCLERPTRTGRPGGSPTATVAAWLTRDEGRSTSYCCWPWPG